ncbi:hypothetical protein [Succinimonas sp.]|uniref:hypothetical protein n=1 Tax=Succinimonas sp. TaxID=1936151 RepID=UPI003868FB40
MAVTNRKEKQNARLMQFWKASSKFGLSAEAQQIAGYIGIHEDEKEEFFEDEIRRTTGLSTAKIRDALDYLEAVNAIERDRARYGKNWGGYFIKFNFDFETWKHEQPKKKRLKSNGRNETFEMKRLNQTAEMKRLKNAAHINTVTTDNMVTTDNIENRDNDLNKHKRERETGGQAALATSLVRSFIDYQKPFLANEYSESEELEPEEKPKGKRQGKQNTNKTFVKPTHEQLTAKIEKEINQKGFSDRWTHYQVDETATRIFAYYEMNGWTVGKNKTPMKSWEYAVVSWLSRNNYLPEMQDIGTTNQQQGQSFKQAQREKLQTDPASIAIERLVKMVAEGTATIESLGITNPETVRKIREGAERMRGYNSNLSAIAQN